MTLYTIDFETYWSTDYTLSKMSNEAYVRDPRFYAHMVGIQVDNQEPICLTHEQFVKLLDGGLRDRLNQGMILAQNTCFDGLILSHHYNVRPKLWLDTMSMFRAYRPDLRASLKVISETLGTGKKGGASGYDVVNTRGKRRLTKTEWAACAEYCKDDCRIAYRSFQILKPHFSLFELRVIDQTIRFTTEPTLLLDPVPLRAEIEDEAAKKAELLARIGQDQSVLASNDKFAELLLSLGVTPPVKPSPTALKKDGERIKKNLEQMAQDEEMPSIGAFKVRGIPWAYAFSKSDHGMQVLLQHEDPLVVAAVEARIGVKSTIRQTRAQSMLEASQRGALPIRINYCAAHTSRDGGADGLNFQNFPRGGRLRDAVIAPPGHSLVVCDLSAIEARVLPYLAGQEDVLDVFRKGQDLYCYMATDVYQRPITKKDKYERQVGKILVLSSGYGMGWKKFAIGTYLTHKLTFGLDMLESLGIALNTRDMAWTKANRPQTLTEAVWHCHCSIAQYLSNVYRQKNDKIVSWWGDLDTTLARMVAGERFICDRAGVLEARGNEIYAPIGNPIRYIGLTQHVGTRGKMTYTRNSREGEAHLWGGTCAENLTQWLSRHIMMGQALKLQSEGLKIAFRCHDEIVGVSPDSDAKYWEKRMVETMSETPSWLPGLPLAAEASIGKTYGEAK